VNLFYHPDIRSESLELDLDESRHVKAMRHHDGERIRLTDGSGQCVVATLQWKKHIAICHVEERLSDVSQHELTTLVMAPTKQHERMEWLVEKAIEIGVAGIYFVQCNNSERPVVRMDRLKRVAIAAIKQSQRFYLPPIHEAQKFADLAPLWPDASHFFAHCKDEYPKSPLKDVVTDNPKVLWIGPEGDFDRSEIEMAQQLGFRSVSLGKARLRTETAALAGLSLLQLSQHPL
jgi:16S rRNA (uracil1498-N3)-methyltransferase